MDKAILVVSFGSSHEDTRKKTIDKIEEDIAKIFSTYKIYTAFTSHIIINILKNRDNIHIDTVSKAMQKMLDDGIKEVVIQPTHILNGYENDLMIKDAMVFFDKFDDIKISPPLLTDTKDYFDVIEALKKISCTGEKAVILMGHGSSHYINIAYAGFDYMLKKSGLENFYIANVEGYPYLNDIIDDIKKGNYKKIILMPFMIVAGEHAKNDMSGNDEKSFKTILTNLGYEVETKLVGLGEYEDIRKIFIEHLYDTIKKNKAN